MVGTKVFAKVACASSAIPEPRLFSKEVQIPCVSVLFDPSASGKIMLISGKPLADVFPVCRLKRCVQFCADSKTRAWLKILTNGTCFPCKCPVASVEIGTRIDHLLLTECVQLVRTKNVFVVLEEAYFPTELPLAALILFVVAL